MAIKKTVEPVEVIEPVEETKKYYINTVLLNFRAKPSMRGDIIKVLPVGTSIEVEKITKGWAKCTIDGVEGYVMEQFIKTVAE